MYWCCVFVLIVAAIAGVCGQKLAHQTTTPDLSTAPRSFEVSAPQDFLWSLLNGLSIFEDDDDDDDNTVETGRKKKGKKVKKKLKKLILPLLLAYKLKFFSLIPVLVGGLILLTASTGLAGFFFALFAASMGLKSGYK